MAALATMPRASTVRVILLSVLLVAMQQAAQWHALDHVRQWLDRPHEQSLLAPQPDAPCSVCALFAGGSAAVPSEAVAPPSAAPGFAAPDLAVSAPATAAPSSYLIRAPPALL